MSTLFAGGTFHRSFRSPRRLVSAFAGTLCSLTLATTLTTGAQAVESSSATESDTLPIPAPSEGMNDPKCVPSPEHPYPVVYIHGTSSNIGDFHNSMKTLQKEGYCTWGQTYGTGGHSFQSPFPSAGGVIDINTSAKQVSGFVDHVLQATGAEKVDLVGHSQGGMLTKVLIERMSHADHVHRVVTMGAPFHGTDYHGMGKGLRKWINDTPKLAEWVLSKASTQQIIGSEFLDKLNALPDTHAGITYTSLYSPADTTVTPNTTSQLKQVPGAHVANVNTAEVCPENGSVVHPQMPMNDTFIALTRWGLERPESETAPAPGSVCS